MDGGPIESSTPAVAARAAALAWLGRIQEAERWLDRVERGHAPAEEFEIEPVLHYAYAFVRLGQGRFDEALAEFRAAERMRPLLARQHVLPVEVRAWIVQTQVLTGDTTPARAALAALDPEERDGAGMRIAAAALALAEGRPQDACDVVALMIADVPEPVVDRSTQVVNCAGRRSTRSCSTRSPETSSAMHEPPRHRSSARSSWPSRTG